MTDNFLSTTPRGLVPLLKATTGVAPVMIWGAPGIGKTQIIQDNVEEIFSAAAKDRGIKVPEGAKVELFERRVNDYDLLDFGGLPYNDDGVQRRATPDIWPGVEAGGKVYGVLFLDEFAQAAREKQTVIQRLFDEGRIGDYVLPGHPKSDPNCEHGLVFIAGEQSSVGQGQQPRRWFSNWYEADPCDIRARRERLDRLGECKRHRSDSGCFHKATA